MTVEICIEDLIETAICLGEGIDVSLIPDCLLWIAEVHLAGPPAVTFV